MCGDVSLHPRTASHNILWCFCVSSQLDTHTCPVKAVGSSSLQVAMYDAPTAACDPMSVCRGHSVVRAMPESAFVQPHRTRSCPKQRRSVFRLHAQQRIEYASAGWQWSERRDETVQCKLWTGFRTGRLTLLLHAACTVAVERCTCTAEAKARRRVGSQSGPRNAIHYWGSGWCCISREWLPISALDERHGSCLLHFRLERVCRAQVHA
jgi:hypothetical protein